MALSALAIVGFRGCAGHSFGASGRSGPAWLKQIEGVRFLPLIPVSWHKTLQQCPEIATLGLWWR
jgi:hypothetical protein